MTTTTHSTSTAGQPCRIRRALGLAIAIAAVLTLGLATAVNRTAGAGSIDPVASETATPVELDGAQRAAAPIAPEREWADRVLSGGPGAAREVAVSPDGNRVLAVRERGVDLWSIQGKRMSWLAIDGDKVDGASWSTDGSRVIVWGGETVRLWNADTGALIATLQAGMGRVAHAELAPDGVRATTLGIDGTRRVWNLSSGAIETIERDVADTTGGSSLVRDFPGSSAAEVAGGERHVYVDALGDVRLSRAI